MILNSLYAFMATLSFGILFNIKGKNLFFASLGGGIGWFCYLISKYYGWSAISSLFIASLIVGIFSEIEARILHAPVTTFAICAIIPMVPGNGMYYTMYQTVTGNTQKAFSTGLYTIECAGAIAAGIVLVSSTTKLIKRKTI